MKNPINFAVVYPWSKSLALEVAGSSHYYDDGTHDVVAWKYLKLSSPAARTPRFLFPLDLNDEEIHHIMSAISDFASYLKASSDELPTDEVVEQVRHVS